MHTSAADLNHRFGVADRASVVVGRGGLTKVVVSAPAAFGEIYLQGGHVTSWVPKTSGEVLYLSPHSLWQDGHAIRGGVPVCFPWFGDKADDAAAPAHGFVRTRLWQLESIGLADDDVVVSMATESDAGTRKWWPFDFRLVCRARFGAQLTLELMVANSGRTGFSVEEALHAYFKVGDAESVCVQGLDATSFIDKTDKYRERQQAGELRVSSETDRVYLAAPQTLNLFDPGLKRGVTVRKRNSSTTVVWNPGAEKSRAMTDLGAEQWRNFVCVEASNVGPYAVALGPGEQHTMTAHVEVEHWHQPASKSR